MAQNQPVLGVMNPTAIPRTKSVLTGSEWFPGEDSTGVFKTPASALQDPGNGLVVTDGTHTVDDTEGLTVTGGVVGGTAGAATLAITPTSVGAQPAGHGAVTAVAGA